MTKITRVYLGRLSKYELERKKSWYRPVEIEIMIG